MAPTTPMGSFQTARLEFTPIISAGPMSRSKGNSSIILAGQSRPSVMGMSSCAMPVTAIGVPTSAMSSRRSSSRSASRA